ncbi:hypothetical protein AVEN_132629-1 [Araneus ventricosus]|uniref:Histone-lysine N-methyltransferase SETMAR n=1 Tax=Araneus ventricosus TaxID=182803 RepID=A0A4Y2AY08_ARAVE|nr:hypothetical protein AVEN_132629-1 [Araneus ventricosus]
MHGRLHAEDHKKQRMAASLTFPEAYNEHGESLLRVSRKVAFKVFFIYNNACPHTDIRTRKLLGGFGWELFGHPPYSPDLAPNNFNLFPHMKTWLATQCFDDDERPRWPSGKVSTSGPEGRRFETRFH